jgi:hypothetical protein
MHRVESVRKAVVRLPLDDGGDPELMTNTPPEYKVAFFRFPAGLARNRPPAERKNVSFSSDLARRRKVARETSGPGSALS